MEKKPIMTITKGKWQMQWHKKNCKSNCKWPKLRTLPAPLSKPGQDHYPITTPTHLGNNWRHKNLKPKSKPPGSHCRGHSPHWLGKFEMLVEVANWKLKFCMKMEIGNWQLKWNDCSEQEGPGMINNKYKAATKIAKNTFPKNVILFVHFSWGSFVQNPFSDCYRPWAWPKYIYIYIYI